MPFVIWVTHILFSKAMIQRRHPLCIHAAVRILKTKIWHPSSKFDLSRSFGTMKFPLFNSVRHYSPIAVIDRIPQHHINFAKQKVTWVIFRIERRALISHTHCARRVEALGSEYTTKASGNGKLSLVLKHTRFWGCDVYTLSLSHRNWQPLCCRNSWIMFNKNCCIWIRH